MATACPRRRALTLSALTAMVLANCGGGDDRSAVTTAPATAANTTVPASTSVAVTTTPIAAPVSDPSTTPPVTDPATSLPTTGAAMSITLLDPGAEPRVALRYRLEPGVVTARLSQSQVLSQTIDGTEVPSAGDTGSVLDMTIETDLVAEGYRLTSEIASAAPNPEVDPSLAGMLAATLETLIGVRIESIIDERGLVLSSMLDEASFAGVADEVAAMMSAVADQAQGATPLPAEPVGVGARWRIVQRIESGGIPITQTFEVTVVSIDGDLVTLSSTGDQAVAPGPVEIPMLPAGATAEVIDWQADITAEIVVDLTQPIPTSTLRSLSRQALLIADTQQSTTLEQTIDLQQRFELTR